MPDDTPQSTPPGWRDVVSLRVVVSDRGLIAITADEPKGLAVMDNSLAQALTKVPNALRELQDAGAEMPRFEGVNFTVTDQPQTTATIDGGLDALRWLLNVSAQEDRPKAQIGILMDRHFCVGGQTVRQSLEGLYIEVAKQRDEARYDR